MAVSVAAKRFTRDSGKVRKDEEKKQHDESVASKLADIFFVEFAS